MSIIANMVGLLQEPLDILRGFLFLSFPLGPGIIPVLLRSLQDLELLGHLIHLLHFLGIG